jgi:hypothetical protein
VLALKECKCLFHNFVGTASDDLLLTNENISTEVVVESG